MQYRVRVVLKHVRPPVWRTLEAPGDVTLHRLHRVLQAAMGWDGAHLYLFHIGRHLSGKPSAEWDMPVANAARTTLEKIAATTSRFTYEYDLGDGWIHDITVEPAPAGNGEKRLTCTGGSGACPPEDCGGPPGYEMFLEAIADPRHDDHEAMLEWIDGAFDPDAFDVRAVNRALSRL